MRFLSLFSGIEAASVASAGLGFDPVAFAEIEPFPSALLKHRFPQVPNMGDVSKFKEWPDFGTVDLVCGGAPCQAFSVAGLRAGLADPRGNLTLTFLAVVDKYRPQWVLFENVPGILSSTSHVAPDPCPPAIDLDGDDGPKDGEEVVVTDEYETDESHAFSCFLAGLQELGYGFAYRVLDAQYVRTQSHPWAVPQRRRRVFVVGYLGDWRRAAAVLLDPESLRGNPAPGRKAGQGVTGSLAVRTGGGGGLGTDFDCDGGLICHDVAPTLNAHFGEKQGLEDQHINGGGGLFVCSADRSAGHVEQMVEGIERASRGRGGESGSHDWRRLRCSPCPSRGRL
jgi:DNA (cytosine-5)-methyltransferase 1